MISIYVLFLVLQNCDADLVAKSALATAIVSLPLWRGVTV